MRCREEGTEEDIFELYLVVEDNVNPLCTTNVDCETIKKRVGELVKEIIKSQNRIHISNQAVGIINNYLRSRIDEELPFA